MVKNEPEKQLKSILKGVPKTEMPKNIAPMALKLTKEAFDDVAWQYEIKWDGFRALAYVNGNQVDLRSRNSSSFNKRFKAIVSELEKLNLRAVLDGEVVTLDEKGCSDFDRLVGGETECLVYYVFDILWYDGHDLMDLPLHSRKELLTSILPTSDVVRLSKHVDGKGIALFDLIQEQRIEGIVAKNRYSHYLPGIRTSNWLKIKAAKTEEAVVAGLLFDKDKNNPFNSLIIGRNEGSSFKYIGLVEAGVSKSHIHQILSSGRASKDSIFTPVPNVNKQVPFRQKIKNAEVIWLQPDFRCNVKYLELDKFGMMRHASFKGII